MQSGHSAGHISADFARNARKPVAPGLLTVKPHVLSPQDSGTGVSSPSTKSKDAVVLEEDGQSFYLES